MRNLFLLTLLLFGSSVFATDDASGREYYTFGIVPQQSATKLARLWTPLLNRISRVSGIKLRFRTAPSIPKFEQRLKRGQYDFAYMNPYHYTVFNRTTGYRAFAKQSEQRIKGIIVVRKNSGISELSDLANATLAFPSPAAFAATLLIQAELNKQGIDFESNFVQSHDAVYRSVANGLYRAGGGIVRTFNNLDERVRDQLKILLETQEFTPHAFAVLPTVESDVVEKIQRTMVQESHNDASRKYFRQVRLQGIEVAKDQDWDDVRALNIKLLEDLGGK